MPLKIYYDILVNILMMKNFNDHEGECMFISIAMCAYNGEKYILEQLNSIASQSRKPDELVICDDKSSDHTIDIIQEFSQTVPFDVRLMQNKKNIGSNANFEQAIKMCQGDIIVLADQDDVWMLNKLEKIELCFENHSNIGAVFSDAELVDEGMEPMNCNLWEAYEFTQKEQKTISNGRFVDVLLKHNVVAGATMAFKRSYINYVTPIPMHWVHDAWIVLLIAACTNVYLIKEPLIKYRQHSKQQIGARKLNLIQKIKTAKGHNRSQYTMQAKVYQDVLTRIMIFHVVDNKLIKSFQDAITHLNHRGNNSTFTIWRIKQILDEIVSLRYFKYSRGFQSVLKDLFM